MLSIYEQLLRLYPASYRQQFEDEMLSVFHELRSENRIHTRLRRGIFYFREIMGVLKPEQVGKFRQMVHAMHPGMFP